MESRHWYLALFLLTVLTLSSIYLSWTIDHGMGELRVERMSLEREPGRVVHFTVYSPRQSRYGAPLPAVLVIHGISTSREAMYAFSIELARRNFTVVSVDLPGHGDSHVPFEYSDSAGMALDCYEALRRIQQNWTSVHDTRYGVLAYSMGFEVALRLAELPVSPLGYVGIGSLGGLDPSTAHRLPGNTLLGIGEHDELHSRDAALAVLRSATGNSSAIDGVTYGSIKSHTAYRLVFAPTDHVLAQIDHTLVTAAVKWMVETVQGEAHLNSTRDPDDTIYQYKVIGMSVGSVSLLVSSVPLFVVLSMVMPRRLRPTPLKSEESHELYSVRHIVGMGMVYSGTLVLLVALTFVVGLNVERTLTQSIVLMCGTGLSLALILHPIVLIMMSSDIINRAQPITGMLSRVRSLFCRDNLLSVVSVLIRSVVPVVGTIAWLLVVASIGAMAQMDGSWTGLYMVRTIDDPRQLAAVLLTVLGVPFFLLDSIIVRRSLISMTTTTDSASHRVWHDFKSVVMIYVPRPPLVAALSWPVLILLTATGHTTGPAVVIGMLYVLLAVGLAITTLLVIASVRRGLSVVPASIVSSFLLAWLMTSSFPLV